VSLPSSANVAARIALAVVLGLAVPCLSISCRSPLGGNELDLALSAQALPGVGLGASLAQRVATRAQRRFDFELGLERQELDDEGVDGDDWTRVFAGLRCAALERRAQLQGRAGVTWLRTDAEAGPLERAGDYGGVYLGTGYAFKLTPALAAGPELTLLWVDAEGDVGGSGLLVELAWRWVWHL
jgi:hypothetical protein